jgi:hypothetical protein
MDATSSILLHHKTNLCGGNKLKTRFNDKETEQLKNFINTINNEKEYYEYMFYLSYNLRFSIEELVGYTLEQLMMHLESKFDSKMTWENYGSYWHVDHIVGVANFNYNSYEDEAFKKCWSLANLQPLYGPDNMAKGDVISEEWNNVELAAQLL